MKIFEFFLEKKLWRPKSFEEKGVYRLSKLMMEENLFMNAKSLRCRSRKKDTESSEMGHRIHRN